MYLFFDTETTGIVNPKLVSIAWVLTTDAGQAVETEYHLLRPEGWTIPPEATAVHGITTDQATQYGKQIRRILTRFVASAQKATFLVAHNLKYDYGVINTSLFTHLYGTRLDDYATPKLVCTMETGKALTKLPGKYPGSYKYPKLSELYKVVVGRDADPGSLHNALTDTLLLTECFWRLPIAFAVPDKNDTTLRLNLSDSDSDSSP